MIQLYWTPRGIADYKKIHAHLLKEAGYRVAIAQCTLLLEAIEQLRRFPSSGPVAEPLECRKLHVVDSPYFIYYRERGGAIEVLSIRHAAQKPIKRLPR